MNHHDHHQASTTAHHEHHDHEGALARAEPEHHGDHDRHAGHSVVMFRNRFWVSAALTLPVLAYAEMLWRWAGLEPPELPLPKLIPFALVTAIYFYGGIVFLRSAAGEIRSRLPGMMTLVAVGITAAYAYSAATTFLLEGEGFYWELATLVDVMLFGHWIEMRSITAAEGALSELAKLLPDVAERVKGDSVEEVAVENLRAGDIVLVRPGARVPADGEIADGDSDLDESMLTGESKPAAKTSGDGVVAGSVNMQGSLRVRVTKTGEDTALAGIARLVAEAQASKSRAQAIADRAAMVLTYVALGAGALTALVWGVATSQGADFVIERAVTVIVIACPHALGLAVPLVIAISTGIGARSGLLVRNRLALERAKDLDVVVFDKTGTLTKGEMGVTDVFATGDRKEEDVLSLAAAAEADSEHPLARAVVEEARRRNLPLRKARGFEAIAGKGVRARVEGASVLVGGPRLLESIDVEVPAEIKEWASSRAGEGKSVIYLIAQDDVRGALAFADVIREESKEAVSLLKQAGLTVAVITGDSEDVARWVSSELGIDEYFAQVLPEDKANRIKDLQQQGRKVAMVGDGVNDAPA